MRPRCRLTLVMACLTATLACAQWAHSQEAPSAGDEGNPPSAASPADASNAASLYRKAIEKYHESSRRITEPHWMAVYEFEADPSRGPSTVVRQALRQLQPVMSLTLNASRRPMSHFDVDYAADDAGEQFGSLRGLIRLLGYEYLLCIEDADVRGAIECIQAMYRMADHVSQERVIMASLIGSAMIAFADSRLDVALDHAIVGPAEATLLLRQLDRMRGDDPMRYLAALAHERQLLSERMQKRYSGEDGVERFKAEYRGGSGDDPAALAAIDGMTAEKLQTMLAAFSLAAGKIAAAFADEDRERGEAEIAAIKSEIDGGEFAALAPYFLTLEGSRLRETMVRTRQQIDDRRDLLTKIAKGEIDPMSLANAAVWYVKAVRQVPDIDPDKRRAIDAYALKHDGPADAALTTILERHDVQQVIATLKQASEIDRCDWDFAIAGWPYAFRWFHADALWCGRLLVADAARLFHAQRYDEAAERMAIGYRMCADIAIDGTVGGSLTAHRLFNDIDSLAAAAVDSRMLNEAQIAKLHEGMSALSRADPFHYQPAIAQMRSNLTYAMRYWVQGLPKALPEMTSIQIEKADALLAKLSVDDVLALAVTYGYWEPSFYEVRPNDMNAAIVGLDTIFDVDAMRATADLAPAITEWARTGQMELISTQQWPRIAPLEQRVMDANTDYRHCVLRFERLAR